MAGWQDGTLQSIILSIFSPKNRAFLHYFNMSLKKVHSIHCLDHPFGAQKFFFILALFLILFLLASLQNVILHSLRPKNHTFLPYFKKSLKKVQSIHCFDDTFGARKIVQFFALFLISFCWFLFSPMGIGRLQCQFSSRGLSLLRCHEEPR